MKYVIISKHPSRKFWTGDGWTEDLSEAARYSPREFPDQIESALGLYTLDIGTQLDGVPDEYGPLEDYREEYERALPTDPMSSSYREPGEWLIDEYGDSLYVVVPVADIKEVAP